MAGPGRGAPSEVRLLKAIQAELTVHSARREQAYRWADHGQLDRSLPGIAKVGGPVIAAAIGRAERFPTGAQFKSYACLLYTSDAADE